MVGFRPMPGSPCELRQPERLAHACPPPKRRGPPRPATPPAGRAHADRASVRQGHGHADGGRGRQGQRRGDPHGRALARPRAGHRRRAARAHRRGLRPRVLGQDDVDLPHHRRGPEARRRSAPSSTPSTRWTRSTRARSASTSTSCSSPSPTTASRRSRSPTCSCAPAPSTSIAVDSVAALTPRAELEGQMGDQTVGLQARMMSQAMRKLAGNLNRTQTLCLFTNQIREKVGVMFGSPETQPGGRALKFYSSQRLDIRRIETLKEGTEAVGNRVRVKVVKNKVAPPFRQAEFDIEFGKGVSTSGCLIDLGIEHNVVTKSGSFFSYGDERLGQGRNNAKAFLDEHAEVAQARSRTRSTWPWASIATPSSPPTSRRRRSPRSSSRRRRELGGARRGRHPPRRARARARLPLPRAAATGRCSSCAGTSRAAGWRPPPWTPRSPSSSPSATSTTPATRSASRRTAGRSTPGGASGSSVGWSRRGFGASTSRRRSASVTRPRSSRRRSRCSRGAWPTPPSSDRARGRALGLLIRRGYELELAHEAVRAFERGERGDAAERHPAEIAPIVPSYYDPEQRTTGP